MQNIFHPVLMYFILVLKDHARYFHRLFTNVFALILDRHARYFPSRVTDVDNYICPYIGLQAVKGCGLDYEWRARLPGFVQITILD